MGVGVGVVGGSGEDVADGDVVTLGDEVGYVVPIGDDVGFGEEVGVTEGFGLVVVGMQ